MNETMIFVGKVFVLIASIYLIATSLVVHTKNLESALVFKVFPFILGMGCLFSLATWNGWIIVIK